MALFAHGRAQICDVEISDELLAVFQVLLQFLNFLDPLFRFLLKILVVLIRPASTMSYFSIYKSMKETCGLNRMIIKNLKEKKTSPLLIYLEKEGKAEKDRESSLFAWHSG